MASKRVPKIGPIEHYDLTRANPFYFIGTEYRLANCPGGTARKRSRWSLHHELEVTVCLEGRVRRFFGDDAKVYGAGDVWFVGSWEPHAIEVLEEPNRTAVLIFPPDLLTDHPPPEAPGIDWGWPFKSPLAKRPVVPEEQRGRVLDIGERICRCGRDEGPFAPVRMHGLLFELLSLVYEWHGAEVRHDVGATRDQQRLRPAIRLVNSRQDRVTIDEAAAACGVGRSAFTELFRRVMGVSFAQFALRHRFGRAAEAVAEGELPIKAIARQWGFANESHLTRVFRQFLGCTPGEHRARHAKE